ncbi:NAD(P)H-dependent glycerol-3-phosphate dehydrogenase [Patescibacteria group bacterium]|nr:NAD(P)H-dependent glycerol-3-phosphate dehydrogenase [Patescibacteria group bacterium]
MVERKDEKIAILTAGSMGIAIGTVFAENSDQVVFGYRSEESCRQFLNTRIDVRFPGIELPDNISATTDLYTLVAEAGLIVVATRARYLRSFFSQFIPIMRPGANILHVIKGFDSETNQRISEILINEDPSLSNRIAVLSGPNYAHEIVKRKYTVTVIASTDQSFAKCLQTKLHAPWFRPYISDDMVGVELGGALKNPVAMAVGIVEGMKLGANASAAMQTRGLYEMIKLAVALGANEKTFTGFAGYGDLSLSCKPPGRNYLAGHQIGQGVQPTSLLESGVTIEGFDSVRSAVELARLHKVDVPILEALRDILYHGLTLDEAGERLMSRNLANEGF